MGGMISINTLDLFSEPVHFSFKKQTYFKTTCGGLVSIIEGIILLLYLYFLIDDLISRKLPIITESIIINDTPPSLNFYADENFKNQNVNYNSTKNIFYNSFGIRKNVNPSYLITLNDTFTKYINLEINQVTIQNGIKNKKKLNFEPCQRFADFNPEFISLTLDKTYCLNDNYSLSGFLNQENSTSLEIKLKKCDKSTSTCMNQTEIDSYTKDLQFEWYYDNTVLNTTNLDKVLSHSLEQKYWDILSFYTKTCTIPIGQDYISLYNSYLPDFIFAPYTTEKAISLRDFITEIIDPDTEGNLLIMNLKSSDYYIIKERRYLDIFAQLATLGGMCDVIYLIGFIFVFHIAQEKFNEELVNTFYNVNDPNSENENDKNMLDFDIYISSIYNRHRNQAIENFYKKFKIQKYEKVDYEKNRSKKFYNLFFIIFINFFKFF